MTVEKQRAEITATKKGRGLITTIIENSKEYEGYTSMNVVFTPWQ